MLRLFVAATLVAFKFSYENVSTKFPIFLSKIIGTDVNTVHALERNFVKSIDYDLQVCPHNFKKLMVLLLQRL
jgi:hypothetical protein